jgi:putative YpdA family bacillithiol system oxidoreductase
MIKVTIRSGPDAGRVTQVSGDAFSIGRARTCEVILTDRAVSREHCRIERQGDSWIVIDGGSANGTFVNNRESRISADYRLAPGDEVIVGNTQLQLEFLQPADEEKTVVQSTRPQESAQQVEEAAGAEPDRAVRPDRLTALRQADAPIMIEVVSGPDRGQVYQPAEEICEIGRSQACTITLNDKRLSRHHATIKRQAGSYRLFDENSTNGTFLHAPDKQITNAVLADGDVVYVGGTQLRITIQGAVAPAGAVMPASAPDEETSILSATLAGKRFEMTLPQFDTKSRVLGALPDRTSRLASLDSSVDSTPGVERDDEEEVTKIAPQAPAPERWIILHVVHPDGTETAWEPSARMDSFTIGREGPRSRADLCIEDRQISRIHLTVEKTATGVVLTDENSTNGTFFQGEKVDRLELDHDAELRLAGTIVTFDLSPRQARDELVLDDDRTTIAPPRSPEADSPGPAAVARQIPATSQDARARAGRQSTPAESVESRSVAFKPRLPLILRMLQAQAENGRISRLQWTTILLTVVAALGSYGLFHIGKSASFSAGPLALAHTQWEGECTTCHPPGGGHQAVNATCANCHAEQPLAPAAGQADAWQANAPHIVQFAVGVQDDCVGCHQEHRGAEFSLTALGEATGAQTTQCWSCHNAGLGVRAFATRPLRTFLDELFSPGEERNGQPVYTLQQPAMEERRLAWLERHAPQPSGLIFAHAGHEQTLEEFEEDPLACTDCHPAQYEDAQYEDAQPDVATRFAFPSHAQCSECHDVGDDDPQQAQEQVRNEALDQEESSQDCLACHTQPDGGIQKVARSTDYIFFSHATDGHSGRCQPCHFLLRGETEFRPVIRSAEFYPLPMDACMSCHEERREQGFERATLACLDCHRTHHQFPSTVAQPGWGQYVSLNMLLLIGLTFVSGIGAYTYWEDTHAKNHLEALTARAAAETAQQAAGQIHAAETDSDERKAEVAQWQTRVDSAVDILNEAQQAFATEKYAEARAKFTAAAAGFEQAHLVTERASEPEPEAAPALADSSDEPPAVKDNVMPFPVVDTAGCIACHGCYDSCPEKVLIGDAGGKSTVVKPSACVAQGKGCRICEVTCPVEAIRVTTGPLVREYERAKVTIQNESEDRPGIFLVGEVIGAPLIKTSVNQGDFAVRYIVTNKPRFAAAPYDVIIVGAGPAGLGAGLRAKESALRYLILERTTIASSIRDYPRDKPVLAEPVGLPMYGDLPVKTQDKDSLIKAWEDVIQGAQLEIHERQEVTDVTKTNGLYTVTTAQGEDYAAAYVILAIGARSNPRKLGVPGEDLPKVVYKLSDAGEYSGKSVLVVGGGDSAVEAAVALAKEEGTTVSLSYRKGALTRAKQPNVEAIEALQATGRVNLVFMSTVVEVRDDRVVLDVEGVRQEIDNDAVFTLLGAEPPKAWLEKIGLTVEKFSEKKSGLW